MFRSTRYNGAHSSYVHCTVYCTVAIFAYYVNIFWIPRQTVTLIFLFDSVLYISETIYWKHTSGGKKTQKNWIFLDLSLSSSVIGQMPDRPDIVRFFIKSKRLTNSALSWKEPSHWKSKCAKWWLWIKSLGLKEEKEAGTPQDTVTIMQTVCAKGFPPCRVWIMAQLPRLQCMGSSSRSRWTEQPVWSGGRVTVHTYVAQ